MNPIKKLNFVTEVSPLALQGWMLGAGMMLLTQTLQGTGVSLWNKCLPHRVYGSPVYLKETFLCKFCSMTLEADYALALPSHWLLWVVEVGAVSAKGGLWDHYFYLCVFWKDQVLLSVRLPLTEFLEYCLTLVLLSRVVKVDCHLILCTFLYSFLIYYFLFILFLFKPFTWALHVPHFYPPVSSSTPTIAPPKFMVSFYYFCYINI